MAFKRARGANAKIAGAFESAYGTSPGSGFYLLPVAGQAELGDEQGLVESDLIGFGREPLDPADDVVNNAGNIVVPVDLRYFGFWLKLLFGAPTTTQGTPATGSIVFAANPLDTATVTINSVVFTFKNSPTLATHVQIGADLAATLANLIVVLNASTNASVNVATYSADTDLTTLTVTHDTIGTAGNTFTLAASVATPSGATLSGGGTTGPYNHVFTSGVTDLLSASVEIGMTDVAQFFMNYGVTANTLAIAMQRSGNLNATIGLIAQGEKVPTGSTGAGTPTELVIERFSQALGVIKRDGVPLGRIQSASPRYSNEAEPDQSIRPDGRIGGVDGGQVKAGVDNLVVRFGDPTLYNLAVNKTNLEVSFGWQISATKKLTMVYHRVRLPKSKLPVTGPKGIQATYNAQAARDPTLQRTMTVTLVNDVSSYA
jgi:hypothetical protein